MEFLSNGEKIGIAVEDSPSKGDTQFIENDDHAVEQFCHPPTLMGGVDGENV